MSNQEVLSFTLRYCDRCETETKHYSSGKRDCRECSKRKREENTVKPEYLSSVNRSVTILADLHSKRGVSDQVPPVANVERNPVGSNNRRSSLLPSRRVQEDMIPRCGGCKVPVNPALVNTGKVFTGTQFVTRTEDEREYRSAYPTYSRTCYLCCECAGNFKQVQWAPNSWVPMVLVNPLKRSKQDTPIGRTIEDVRKETFDE